MKVIRLPLMVMGMVALLAGMWAGLVRLGWGWPPLQPALPIAHGPLMISGFLGTVIGLERAVALSAISPGRLWTYCVPLLAGLGGRGDAVAGAGVLRGDQRTAQGRIQGFVFGAAARLEAG